MRLVSPDQNYMNNRGFSLIEVMVVMVIIGLMTTAAVTLMPSGGRADIAAAKRMVLALENMRRQSIMTGRVLGLSLNEDGLAGGVLSAGEWETSGSEQFDDLKPFLASAILEIEGNLVEQPEEEKKAGFRPDIWFLPTGEHMPFKITATIASDSESGLPIIITGKPNEPIQRLKFNDEQVQ